MKDKSTNEVIIARLMKVCISGTLQQRMQYLDPLVDALRIYVNGRMNCTHVDEVRQALEYLCAEQIHAAQNPKYAEIAQASIKNTLIDNANIWLGPQYDYGISAILMSHESKLKNARKLLDVGNDSTEVMLAGLETGLKDVVYNYARVMKICLEICLHHNLIQLSEEDLVEEFKEV